MTWSDLDALAKGHGVAIVVLAALLILELRRNERLQRRIDDLQQSALDVAANRAAKLDQVFAFLIEERHEPGRALVARVLAREEDSDATQSHRRRGAS